MPEQLHIPPFVNYECQLCGWCCRQYDINFSEADHERLGKYDWGKLEPALAGKEWRQRLPRSSGHAAYRLCYSPDGACVFLADNKCLMHKHVGELGKTIGCCIYPFTFVGTPSGVYVGCRFSCKALAYGLGEPVLRREAQLRKQLALCVAGGQAPQCDAKVDFDGLRVMPWNDYLALEAALLRVLLRDDLPIVRRVFLFAKFIEILRAAQIENVRGTKFRDLIEVLESGLFGEASSEDLPEPPGALWRLMFRQFCFQFQRRQGGAYRQMNAAGRLKERLRQFWAGIEFAVGRGAPALPDFPGRVRLAKVADMPLSPLGEPEQFALSRFLAAKLFGKQYFGKLFFDYNLLDGLSFLLLTAGAVMWYARARALARGAETTSEEDAIEAIRYVDFCYGYSRASALGSARRNVRLLSRGDLAARLALSQFA